MGDEYGVRPGDYVKELEEAETVEGKKWTKETAQQEWFDKFQIRKTIDWQGLLETDLEKARNALQYVIDNRDHFPQYDNGWMFDRKKELSQQEWFDKFQIRKTVNWQALLASDIDKAREALQHD